MIPYKTWVDDMARGVRLRWSSFAWRCAWSYRM